MYGFTDIFLIFARENMKRARKSTRNECNRDFRYAKVLKYFQFTSFFHIKLMQSEKIR